ncbi:sigma-70 family RNA polymerase sigma factor [Cytophagaceae bacterium YF14B1]|uniref:Sigma-70 family RNA polymerase sigma factor n=1 Tax=Xanthocytophaga flava TaxID=3048013 RepID=A0AAE3QR33_9BACT|nr:sigma-70 family RNA polymerase sigma factor [Xanthocytophaga flavus]MDJ1481556.1 sigma-70 family RNA polymerase sigma factor [Xanthocytophaga flavus]
MKDKRDVYKDRILPLKESDLSLWNRFRSGDREAFSTIYRLYVSALYNYGMKLSRDREQVKDAVQDLFIELWKKHSTIGETTNIKYYLYKCIRRKIIRNIEQSAKFLPDTGFTTENNYNPVSSPEDLLIDIQSVDQKKVYLNKALTHLTQRQREALFLKYYDSLSNSEIASLMAVNEQSVYNLVYQGLQLLRKFFPVEVLLFFCILSF